MLVLSRGVGEAVRVGSLVSVRVLSARGGKVKLGIEAPEDVKLLREELADFDEPEPADNPHQGAI